MDFQSISNFLVQRLGREGERESSEGVISVAVSPRLPPLRFCYNLFLSELLLPSSSPIMRERARFPVSLISKDNNVLIRL